MAHFAQLDENNFVKNVIVISNEDIVNEYGQENESIGIDLCKNLIQDPNSRWIQTSYNSNFRNKYAGIGFSYLENLDAFIEPQPYSSWSFDQSELKWIPPIPYPEDNQGNIYYWDEDAKNWSKFDTQV